MNQVINQPLTFSPMLRTVQCCECGRAFTVTIKQFNQSFAFVCSDRCGEDRRLRRRREEL